MDPNLIYIKTASGEDAIQQRTRVIQRNVRMVLILVDGQSSVADLSRKTGNSQLTENALTELEKGGFIEPKLEQRDSLWEESKKVAQEIRSAAVEKAFQLSSKSSGHKEKYPDFSESRPKEIFPDSRNQGSDAPISMHSVFDGPAMDSLSFPESQFSIAPVEPVIAEKTLQKKKESGRRKKSTDTKIAKPSMFSQLKTMWASADFVLDEKPIKIRPVRQSPGYKPTWSSVLFFSVLGILGLGYVAGIFFPFASYLPEVERSFAQSVGRPAKVEALRGEIYPAPTLTLGNVRVGSGKDEIRIGEIRLQPELSSLFSRQRIFKKAVLSGVQLPAERIAELPRIFASLAKPGNDVRVAKIGLEKTGISFVGLVLNNLEAEVKTTPDGAFDSLLLRSAEGGLNIVARSTGERIDLEIEAYGWRSDEISKFTFDSANIKAKLEKEVLSIQDMDLRLFDGVIRGTAKIPAGAKPKISGDIHFERINAARLGDALGIGKRLVGEAEGKVSFTATADRWATVFSSINAEGEFNVQRGNITGIDLAEAVRRVSSTSVQGGMTSFEELSGRMKLAPERNQFFGLLINSGLMRSTGYIDIARDHKLSGRLELQMRGSVNQTRVPVTVEGTLESPSVLAWKR